MGDYIDTIESKRTEPARSQALSALPRERPWPDMTADEFRGVLERAVSASVRYWGRLPERRAFTRPEESVRDSIREDRLPDEGRPIDEILERIEREVVPYPNGVGHPRWWGFVSSPPHAAGIAAELVAATLDNYVHGTAQIAVDVELKAIEWMADLVGLPTGASGIMTSGGSVANLIGLAAAREKIAPGTRARGLASAERPLSAYASTEIHSCVPRAFEMLGLGSAALRLIPTDEGQRIDMALLRDAITRDRRAGIQPMAVIGSAGTVNTGAIDPLDELADVAAEAGCWFHVDGAYGGFAGALPELADRFRGIERADSVAADPHKWLYAPVEAGTLIARDPAALETTFRIEAGYLTLRPGTYLSGSTWLPDRGPQLSRGFKALKVWAVMQAIGLAGYRDLWRKDIAVAQEVTRLAHQEPRLEVLAESELSIFCIRYLPRSGDIDAFNRELLDRTHRDGRSLVTPVVLDGRYGLRGCVVNYRSTLDDARIFVDSILELGEKLEREMESRGAGGS